MARFGDDELPNAERLLRARDTFRVLMESNGILGGTYELEELEDFKIFVASYKSPNPRAKDLVLIHSQGYSGTQFFRIVPLLRSHFNLYLFELANMGCSEGPELQQACEFNTDEIAYYKKMQDEKVLKSNDIDAKLLEYRQTKGIPLGERAKLWKDYFIKPLELWR